MESKTINLQAGGKQDALLHVLTTFQKRKIEISDLEKHIEHLENIDKPVKQNHIDLLEDYKETLNYITSVYSEMKIWSRNQINEGDIILMPFYRIKFTVKEIQHQGDHSGRFENTKDKKNTFYTLSGIIEPNLN